MKKYLSIILVLVIVFSMMPMAFAANTKTFDYQTVLGSKKNYEYDKFEKQWSYYEAATNTFTDAYVIVGLKVYGDEDTNNPLYTDLYVKIIDKDGEPIRTIESIDFLIGDDLYSYETMLEGEVCSEVILRHVGQALIEAINKADVSDITIRINTTRDTFTFEASEFDDFSTTIKTFCKVFVDNNIDDYYVNDTDWDYYESVFPLTINGKVAKSSTSSKA